MNVEKEVKLDIREEEKQKLIRISEISIHLDNYDDIFSDFDPRPYSQRAISDDLLVSMEKAVKVKESGSLEVRFLIPQRERNGEHETLIKRRLREYFRKHHSLKHKEINKIRKKGLIFIGIGSFLTLLASYLSSISILENSHIASLPFHWIITISEVGGWFTIWTGFERWLSTREERKEEMDFYERMTKAEFHFTAI